MPFLDRYILEVYKTDGCIKIRPTKVIKWPSFKMVVKMLINIELGPELQCLLKVKEDLS